MSALDQFLPQSYSKEKKTVSSREETTVTAIKDAFLQLLKQNPIEKITVATLCQKVGINRSTFYRHFNDVYALLDTIAEEAHAELFTKVLSDVDLSESFEEVGYQYIYQVCAATEQKKDLYQLLLFGHTPSKLYDLMIQSVYQLYNNAHEGPSLFRPAPDAHLHYYFLVNGMIGVWAAWVKEDCKTNKKTVARAMQEQINGFYFTMTRLYGRFSTRE